ncbi:MAG: hypothetical protein O7H41_03990 [Planctomycetota bacterium]|nr:hypothetical protein [Planctomycetota bacterium]
MRRGTVMAAIAVMAFAGIAFAGGDGKISWVDNYEDALAQAKRTGRPLMVKFFATW